MIEPAWQWLGFHSLPGPRAFLTQLYDGLMSHGVLWLGLPGSHPSWLIPSVVEDLQSRARARVFFADASGGLRGIAPAHWLASLASPLPSPIRSVSEFLDDPELADAVFVVSSILREEWKNWSGFLRLFRAERERKARLAMPMLIVSPPSDLPYPDLRSVFGRDELRWHGRISRVDTEIAASCICDGPKRDDVASMTARGCIVEMSGWDLRMVDFLATLPLEDQLDPISVLEAESKQLPILFPCWSNGLVDFWNGSPFEHSLSLARRNQKRVLRRRLWSAQVRHLFPLLADIKATFVRRYRDELVTDGPLTKIFHTRTITLTEPEDFELWDITERLRGALSSRDINFLRLCHKIRTGLAHLDPVSPEYIITLSNFWSEHAAEFGEDLPGWNWPRCGQKLIMLVGPSGAGKTHWAAANCDTAEVLSSDRIRQKLYGSLEVDGSQSVIFAEMRQEARWLLSQGRSAVIDATNLRQSDRLANLQIVPPDFPVEYIVINRPLEEKRKDGGWRLTRKGLLESHDKLFADELPKILSGDGHPNVTVVDLRGPG